ncbi:hypothetical protein [Actinomyces minihominis]|uniref:hypothetical protein n=1 Tax=Actinomyces minihominis TaxID=2002838 RepID=UPI000C085402|nr:hypothetical protein [Actinomyces minihominis]
MSFQAPTPTEGSAAALRDERGASLGLGRLVMAAFWIAGVALSVVAVTQLFVDTSGDAGVPLVTLLAGIIYLLAAIGLTHNGRRMRKVAWVSVSAALGGPVLTGLLGLRSASVWSPWTDFGVHAWFVSLILPAVGIVWLWWSNPRRIVEIAEGIERAPWRDREITEGGTG